MSPLSVLVVIPVFNRERLIGEALECVARQTRPPAALVVIDDGSSDGSAGVVEAFFARAGLPFSTKLIRQPNRGVGEARARAVALAPPCDLLAMLDSDDLWPADYLEKMGEPFERDANTVGASCDRVIVDAQTGAQQPKPSSHLTGRATLAIFTRGTSPSSSTVIRMEAFRNVGGYDRSLRYKDDANLYLRVSLLGMWAFVPGLTVLLRRNTSGPGHLTHKSIPNRLEMAMMLERFVTREGGDARIPEGVWRRHLARLWFRLGRDLADAGSQAEASWCFRHATELRPMHLRAWWRRATSLRECYEPDLEEWRRRYAPGSSQRLK